mmetsp:Transcript_26356/g.39510  ORF Transcript_26356/g.39510 Transcript_26356/m.39510 type:complete len:221 (-) Transcript_26356:1457-2119(-)
MTSEATKSALQDNIESKGKNAYYFAHAHKANGPKWDGRPQPRLLVKHSDSQVSSSSLSASETGEAAEAVAAASGESLIKSLKESKSSFDFSKSNITKYAFIDEGKKVKLYIDMKGVGDVCNSEEDIKLDWSERSFSLKIYNYSVMVGDDKESGNDNDNKNSNGGVKCLSFGRLHGFISKAAARVKKDRIILTLWKKVEEGKDPEDWPQIAQKGEDDHEIV